MSTYSFDTIIDRRATASIKWSKYADDGDVIPMWVADMEFATSPAIQQALTKRIDHPIYGYTHAPQSLVTEVQDYLQRQFNWSIDPDWLVWLPGVVPGLTMCCRIAGEPGSEILVNSPVYHPLLEIPELTDRKRVCVPMLHSNHRWSIDFDALEAAITENTSALLLCSPHNPVGTLFTDTELARVADICAARNVLVISDEIHCDLILDPERKHCPTVMAAPALADHIITLMSPSKTFNLAGANCSFAIISNPVLRKKYQDACHYVLPIMPTFSYVAAEAAYRDGWDWHSQLIDYLRGNHEYLRNKINNIEGLWMDPCEATYLGWINTGQLPVDDAGELFRAAGVGLSPGAQFGDPDYQRLNFACPRSQLEEGLRRIKSAVDSL